MRTRKFLAIIFVVFVNACGSFKVGIEPTFRATGSAPSFAIPTATRITIPSAAPSSQPTALPAPTELPPTATPSLQPIAAPAPTELLPTVTPSLPPIALSPPKITPSAPLSITLFIASPETIDSGEPFTLTWQATGGEVRLTPLNWSGQMLTTLQPLSLAGSLTMTSEGWRYPHTYVLAAVDPVTHQYVQASLSVKVRCPDAWFFAEGPAGCPLPPITGTAAIQHFEHGLMIWLEPRQRIYILYAEHQVGHPWDEVEDHFVEGQPESDPNLTPPAGLYQPIRGFGLAWRDERPSPGYRVRDRLGWATGQETVFQGAVQCRAIPKYVDCYLLQNDGQVIVLGAEHSSWKYWGQP
jgi:hypothetical protein